MREKAEIFMPLYLGDYDRDTSDLSFEEHGFYLAILRALWAKGGTLPTAPDRLARVLRTDVATLQRLWPSVVGYLTIEGEGFTQGRLLRELEKALGRVRAAAENGRIGGEAKAKRLAELKQKGSNPSVSLVANGKRNPTSSPTQDPDLSLSSGSGQLQASDPDPKARAIPGAPPPAPVPPYTGPKLMTWLGAAWTAARTAEFGGTGFGAGNGISSEKLRDVAEKLAAAPDAVPHVDASMRKFWADVKAGRAAEARKCATTPPFAFGAWFGSFSGDFEAAIGVAPQIPAGAAASDPYAGVRRTGTRGGP